MLRTCEEPSLRWEEDGLGGMQMRLSHETKWYVRRVQGKGWSWAWGRRGVHAGDIVLEVDGTPLVSSRVPLAVAMRSQVCF